MAGSPNDAPLSTRRARGTRRRISAHSRIVAGEIFAGRLKLPNVTRPSADVDRGSGAGSGLSGRGRKQRKPPVMRSSSSLCRASVVPGGSAHASVMRQSTLSSPVVFG